MGKRLGVRLRTKKTRGNDKKGKVNGLDRTSELHLSLKEAARTSILSERDVWIIRDNVLDFHDRPITLRDCDSMADSMAAPIEFVNRVDEVVENYKEPTLSEFIVKSDRIFNPTLFESTLPDKILKWIYFAIRKRVQSLDLALSNFRYLAFHKWFTCTNWPYAFPCEGHSFPSLNLLLSKRKGFPRFVTNLRVLRLQCFNVDEELLEYLLSNCPVLEHLSVSFANSVVNLQVRAPSTVKLKYFEIHKCQGIKTIHFDDAPNLECIRFSVYYVNISIKSAPKLINVSLLNTHDCILDNIELLSNNLSQPEVLTLEFEIKYAFTPLTFRPFPILTHLKHLILKLQRRHSYLDLNSLLIAMPSLYRLHLTVEEKMTQVLESTCSHKCLKLVEWDGCRGDSNDYSFVTFLAKTCKVLEKITITKGKPLVDDEGKPLVDDEGKPLVDDERKPLVDDERKPLVDDEGKPLVDDEEVWEKYEKLIREMLEGVELIIHESRN